MFSDLIRIPIVTGKLTSYRNVTGIYTPTHLVPSHLEYLEVLEEITETLPDNHYQVVGQNPSFLIHHLSSIFHNSKIALAFGPIDVFSTIDLSSVLRFSCRLKGFAPNSTNLQEWQKLVGFDYPNIYKHPSLRLNIMSDLYDWLLTDPDGLTDYYYEHYEDYDA